MKKYIESHSTHILVSILFWVALLIMNYFFLLIINLRYAGIVFWIVVYLLLMTYISFIKVDKVKFTRKRNKKSISKYIFDKQALRSAKTKIILIFVTVGIIYGITSSKLLHADAYKTLIKVNESGQFANDFEMVDINKLPVVDHQFAMRIGDKVMGEKFINHDGIELNYGSEYEVSNFYDIYYNGKPYMVAPLSYRGFFKWSNNKAGTPGYVLIDKYTGDRELITKVNDKDLQMAYMPSAFFGKDLHRYLYQNGYRYNELYKYFFEIDEEGNPYWVVIETEYTIAINGGKDVSRVILVNAVTGEIKHYKPYQTPEWVDNIYPKELVIKQLNDWGSLKNGYFNSLFAQKGVNKTTDGCRRVYNNNKIFHYTGLTSAGGDESSTGFVYVDSRTKETKLYSIVGATETAAMKSAEGQVNNYSGYYATFPISLNVNNQPTFFITIKDSNGIIKKYSFVNIKDYTKVGLGDKISSAYNSYLITLGEDGDITDNDDLTDINGTVERINWNVIEGKTIYYVKLEDDDVIYHVTANVSDELPVTLAGDTITMKVTGNIVKFFDNNDI